MYCFTNWQGLGVWIQEAFEKTDLEVSATSLGCVEVTFNHHSDSCKHVDQTLIRVSCMVFDKGSRVIDSGLKPKTDPSEPRDRGDDGCIHKEKSKLNLISFQNAWYFVV